MAEQPDNLPETTQGVPLADTGAAEQNATTEQAQSEQAPAPEPEIDPLDVPSVRPRTLIEMRTKLQQELDQTRREAEELRAWRAQAEAELNSWHQHAPGIQKALTEREQFAQEKAEMEAQVNYYKRVAAENGVTVDESVLRNELAARQQQQFYQTFEERIAARFDEAWKKREQEWEQRVAAERANEERRRQTEEANKRWQDGWNAVVTTNPKAALWEPFIKDAWAKNPNASPVDLFAGLTGMVTATPQPPAEIRQAKAQQAATLPKTLGSSGIRSGEPPEDDVTKFLTLRERAKYESSGQLPSDIKSRMTRFKTRSA